MRMIGAAAEMLPAGADRTPEWYGMRRNGITASEIAAILGLSRFSSPMALYFRKHGDLDEEPDNWRMALGRELEPYVLRCFTQLTGVETEPCGLVASTERPWQLATPDAVCGHIPVEAKTSLSEEFWGASGSSVIPLYYRTQLLWQMDVLGADHGYLCVIFLRSGEPRWYRVDWDGEDIAVMREAGADFQRRLTDGDAPPPDAADATTMALRQVYRPDPDLPDAVCSKALRRSFSASLKAKAAAESRHALLANKIRVAMGQSTRLRDPDGGIVATKRGPHGALYPGRDLVQTRSDSQTADGQTGT